MHRPGTLLVLVLLTASATSAWAVDLTKIDRALANEPKYQTVSPKYCLLVFGPEAKTRVWLVADGDNLLVSQNDGDLQGPDSRVVPLKTSGGSWRLARIGDVAEVDGTKHTGLVVTQMQDSWRVGVALAGTGRAACRTQGAGFHPAEKLVFADRPQDAPIVHFNGPKTLGFVGGAIPTLERGERPTTVTVGLGTPGLGKGTFASFQGCAVSGGVTFELACPSTTGQGEAVKLQGTIGNRH